MAVADALGTADHLRAEGFRPRPPWLGGDLQTVRNYIVGRRVDLSRFAEETHSFHMDDGTGDVLLGTLNRPAEPARLPLLMLVHGLTGCADSIYMRATARHFLALDYAVLRLNLRGAGPSALTCRDYYHAGRSADLRAIVAGLPASLVADGLVMIGYSLGGGVVIKYLAEAGENAPVRAAGAVSAPIDLRAASLNLYRPRNRLYHRWLLARLKAECTTPPSIADADMVAAIRRAPTLYAFDDCYTAPRTGHSGVEEYYARASARAFLPAVRVPTLVVHARDDPWIPYHAYRDYDWSANAAVIPLITAAGGHVGFHGRGDGVPWHDRALEAFVAGL